MTDAATTAARIDAKINTVGGSLMFHPATLAVGAENEFNDMFALYVGGRASVLGDVEPDVVRSAFAWFCADRLAPTWGAARSNHSAADLRTIYAEALAAGGRAAFAHVEGIDTFVSLGRRVIDEVEPMGTALFAGWRSVPLPDDPAGAAALVVQTLRELRGDTHIHAVASEGLTPLQAVLAHPSGGPDRARMFGWPEPYPDGEPWRAAWATAEERTAQMMAAHYEPLTADERSSLTEVVPRMLDAISG